MSDVKTDVSYMKKVLRLAAKGRGLTSPNPMVGAIIVNKGRIVGQGFHHKAGEPHAEILALHRAGPQARGGTMYVNLEPCCHTNKRTSPCVPSIINSGLQRVVIAMKDPNPQVSSRGIRQLRRAVFSVEVGCLHEEAEQLNEVYCHWIQTGQPFVILKAAMSLDGKIATATGESQWITGKQAREHVHYVRSQVDAILVGISTILKDDPKLTVRLPTKTSPQTSLRQPVRVILDSTLRIPQSAQVLRWMVENPTVIATTNRANKKKIERLTAQGATILVLPQQKGRVSFPACLRRLSHMGLTSVLVEGGGEVNATALRSGLVNKVLLYVAPFLLGGQNSKNLIGGVSSKRLIDAVRLRDVEVQRVGEDVLIAAYVI